VRRFGPAGCLHAFALVRPAEALSVALLFCYALVLLVCYYLLKTLREPLLLAEGSAEIKSYAQAVIALVLLVLVPLYAAAFKRVERARLVRGITVLFIGNLLLFAFLGEAGVDIAFAYYVWVGVFGVVILAQFWAHAADAFDVESGERVFPAIVVGATLGGLVGPLAFRVLYPAVGIRALMLICAGLLVVTLPLVGWSRRAVPADSRRGGAVDVRTSPARSVGARSGFALVLADPYLRLLALLVVLLNCVNSTGEYLLAEVIVARADEQVAIDAAADRGALIAGFYASFFFVVNALAVAAQLLLVGRLFGWIGVQGAVLVAPVIALVGYGLAAFLPVFTLLRILKTFENSVDYSVTNTARHALYLPLPPEERYAGKTAIDAFFWRFGDLLQAGMVYFGVNALDFGLREFACVNAALAVVWIGVALGLARGYARCTAPAAARHALVSSSHSSTPASTIATR